MKLRKPDAWEKTALEALATLTLGGDWGKEPEFDSYDYTEALCIRGSEFRNWNEDRGKTASLRKVKKTSLASRALRIGDILVEISGGGPDQPVGRTVLIDKISLSHSPNLPKICTNFLRLFRPSGEIDSRYLNLFLQFFYKSGDIRAYQAGSNNLRNLKFDDYLGIEIPIPPLVEQRRIIVKIEELFSELDKGIESLKTAQALLKHAFEGKLTAQWRAESPDKLETAHALLKRIQKEREQRYQQQVADWEAAGRKGRKPKALTPLPPLTAEESIELPKLPQGWRWIRPEEIASQEPYSIGIGPFGSNLKVSDYRDSGVPLVFVKNITRSNFSADLKFIDQEKYEELYAHSVQALDLLITKMGDPPGDCEIYPVGAPNAVLTADCLKYRLWDKFANRLMYKHCINSNFVKRQLGLITRGVAQKKISVERFKTIALPLMAVAEQQALVEILDSKLSEADQLDKTLDAALQQAEALRLSILKKAFSGQLVPQDPTDEPASVLLARIKAERSAQPTSKKARK